MDIVSVNRCDSYDQKEIDNSIEKCLEEINFKIKPNSKILIKPNLVSNNSPEQHSITHYTLIDFLCRYFLEKKCSVVIGESASFYIQGYTNSAYKTSKIYELAEKYSVPLVAFEDEKIVKVQTKKLKFLNELYLPEMINDFDLIVNVPKLKTHALMRLSGAVKNLYGIVPGGYKQILHLKTKNINEMAEIILDVYESLKPKILTVADAVIGLDGGPAAVIGKPKKIGYILASMNPLALDVIACQMIGYLPEDLPTLTLAEKRKLVDLKKIKQIGSFEKVQFEKLKKGPVVDFKKQSALVTKTYAIPSANYKCTLCGKCADYCPAKAISIENKKWKLDKSKCVYCYSCVQVCPNKAIKLKIQPMNHFFIFVRRLFRI